VCDEGAVVGIYSLLSRCRNVHMHAASDATRQDEFKVATFVSVLRGVGRVGVPLNGASAFKVVEKWPIIQAFANDDVGGGGFFTMVHEVVDVTPLLQEVEAHVDTLRLRHAVMDELPRCVCVCVCVCVRVCECECVCTPLIRARMKLQH
jgi:hypothetical protein